MNYRMFHKIKNVRGFTLLEIIISMVVAGILAAMLVAFMGSDVVKSANPVTLAQNGAYVNEIMENMSADYRYQMASSPSNGLTNFKAHVDTTNYYSDGAHPYTVADSWISFSTGTPVTEASGTYSSSAISILKVTVTYNNVSVTALFAG